jgi:hypothetical protein
MDLADIIALVRMYAPYVVLILNVVAPWILNGLRKKAKACSVFFGDLSLSFKDPAQTDADFDKLWQDFEVIVADPPGQPLTWEAVAKIDWGPGGLWKQLKGPAFLIAYALLGVSSALLALIEILAR